MRIFYHQFYSILVGIAINKYLNTQLIVTRITLKEFPALMIRSKSIIEVIIYGNKIA